MKKKIVSFLLLAAMILTFAACGETPEVIETQQPTQTAEPTQEVTPGTEEPGADEKTEFQLPICEELTELSMLYLWDQTMAGNLVADPEGLEGFNWLETQTNVHINFIAVANQAYSEQLNLTIASDEYPDMFTRIGRFYRAGIQHGIEEEIFLDFTDLMAEYAPNYKAVLDGNIDLVRSLYTDSGRMAVFYPVYTQAQPGPGQGLAVRQDWLDELNLEVPVTYDDYEEVMEAFQVAYDVEMGVMMVQDGTLNTNGLVSGFNICAVPDNATMPFYVVDGQVKLGRVGQEFYEYLCLMHDWYERGFISPDFTSWNGVDSYSKNPLYAPSITTGKTGIFNIGYGDFTRMPAQCTDPDAAFTALTDPVHKEGDIIQVGKPNFNVMYDNGGVAISTQCENWEIAMKWLDWFYTEDGAIFNMCGLQGITWDYDENGEVWWTDMYLNPEEGVTTGNILFKYAAGTISWGLSMKNEMDYRKYQKTADPGYAARLTWGSNITFDRTFPYGATLNAEEGSQFNNYYSDFLTYTQEITPQFITGDKSLDEYAAYEKEVMETLHGQEMIDIKQQAYDRYMAK